jgi:hypothetical protein
MLLQAALHHRRDTLGLPLDPDSSLWLSQFEKYAPPKHWTKEWNDNLRVSESAFWSANSPFSEIEIRGLGNNNRFVEAEPAPSI